MADFGLAIAKPGPRWFKASNTGEEDNPHVLVVGIGDGDNELVLYYNENTEQYELPISMSGHVCVENTTTTVLASDGVFTGEWQDTLNYGVILVSVISDQDSATDGLEVQFSSDGATVHDTDVFSILADTGKTFSFQPVRRYLRVKYNNGSTNQTSFNLETTLRRVYVKPSSHRIQDSIVAEDDAELVKAVLTGETPDETYKNVQVSTDGNLTISDNSSGLAIAEGNVTGKSFIHKFGNAPDFDTADGVVTVWDGAEDGTAWEQMLYQYSDSADIDYLTSNGSDYQDIEVQGLASDYSMVTQTITLTGATPVSLTTNLIRVFRLKNVNSVDNVGHVFCWVSGGGDTAGVPDVTTDIRAIIQPGNNQTLMAVFTIPVGKTGYMRDWYAATSGASRDSNYPIELRSRPFGGVFQLKHISSLSDNGSSHIQHGYTEPEIFEAKTDIEMRASMTVSGGTAASVSSGFDIVLVND